MKASVIFLEPLESGGTAILSLALVLLSAFFSMAETSLTSLGKFKVRAMVEEGKKGAEQVEKVTGEKDKLLSSVLIGSNFSNIALSAIVTAITLSVAGNNAVSIAIATAVATLIVLIFGEMIPKIVAIEHPEKISLLIIRPLRLVMTIIAPFAAILNLFITMLLRPLGFSRAKKESALTENELKTMLEVGFEEGVIAQDEHKMLENVMEFDDALAKDVMTPRTDMAVIELDNTYDEVLGEFIKVRFSRLPVYKENIDDIVGVLHIKDFILASGEDRNDEFKIEKYMREPFFTLELKNTRELFTEMRRASTTHAIILDEYGGTSGFLTMEDLVEEIVGEIFDEHDNVQREVEQIAEHEYVVSGAMKIGDFNDLTGAGLTSEEYDSVGGYVMGLAGGIPDAGMALSNESGAFSFVVEEVKKNRVERLRIKFEKAVLS